jgi:hypothetical protein
MYSLIESILLDLTEKDYLKTQLLITTIEEQFDDIDDFIKKSISHILNFQHISNARCYAKKADSELWDLFPVVYWHRLHDQNYLETKNIIEGFFIEHDLDDEKVLVFQRHLNNLFEHTNHHRAQMIRHLKLNDLRIPNMQMIMIQ